MWEMQCRRWFVSSFAHHPLYLRAVGQRPSRLVASERRASSERSTGHEFMGRLEAKARHVFGRVFTLGEIIL